MATINGVTVSQTSPGVVTITGYGLSIVSGDDSGVVLYRPSDITIKADTPDSRILVLNPPKIHREFITVDYTLRADGGYFTANGHAVMGLRLDVAVIATLVRGVGLTFGDVAGAPNVGNFPEYAPNQLVPSTQVETWLHANTVEPDRSIYMLNGNPGAPKLSDGVDYAVRFESLVSADRKRQTVRYTISTGGSMIYDSGVIIDPNDVYDASHNSLLFAQVFGPTTHDWSIHISGIEQKMYSRYEDTPAPGPSITSPGAVSAIENQNVLYTATTSGGTLPVVYGIRRSQTDDSSLLTIDRVSGVVKLVTGVLDYDATGAKRTYTFNVVAADSANKIAEKTVTVTVTNDTSDDSVPSGYSFTSPASATASENQNMLYTAATSQMSIFSLKTGQSDDASLLNIDAFTGAVTLKTGTLDFDSPTAKTTYRFTVRGTNSTNQVIEQPVTVTVTNDTSDDASASGTAYVLMIGQSNIGNHGVSTDNYTPTHDVMRLSRDSTWVTAVSVAGSSLATSTSIATGWGGNMDGRIGDGLIATGKWNKVKIVNTSVGGSRLGWWRPDAPTTANLARSDDPFAYTNNRLSERLAHAASIAARDGFKYTHVLIHIGESDAQNPSGPVPYSYFKDDFQAVRTYMNSLGIDAPIFMGRTSWVPHELTGTYPEIYPLFTDTVNEIINENTGVYEGTNSDLYLGSTYRYDLLHFNSHGMDVIADEWVKLIATPKETVTVVPTNPVLPTAYVLVFGQSNIANYGSTDNYVPKYDVKRLSQDGTWVSAVSPAGTTSSWATGYGGNLDGRIGDGMMESGKYSSVKIINIAVGGSKLGWWWPFGNSEVVPVYLNTDDPFTYTTPNNYLSERFDYAASIAARDGFQFTHVVMHIGESDASWGTPLATFQNDFLQVKNYLTSKGITAPIFVGRTSWYLTQSYPAFISTVNGLINTYPNVYAGPNTDVYTGTTYRYDDLHFNPTGLDAVGRDWATYLNNPIESLASGV